MTVATLRPKRPRLLDRDGNPVRLADLKGRQEPRIFTPPLRELTPETTLGFKCVAFCEQVLEIKLVPWQEWAVKHILELTPDGQLRFRTVILLVARQNGKSMLSLILALFFMYILKKRLVIGTAQDLDVAEDLWEEAVGMIDSIPELAELKGKTTHGNGRRSLTLKSGEKYRVKAANRKAGRSLSGDLVMLDELREHQNWEAWAALTKTTMARAFALILCLSNAGDASSVVLRYLRKMAHLSLGDPDGINAADDPNALLPSEEEMAEDGEPLDVEEEDLDTLGIFEWSAPPNCGVWDTTGWCYANPSLGWTDLTGRTIASAAGTDPEWVFRTEVLCQWSDDSINGPFPHGAWMAGTDPESRRAPGAQIACCIDVSATGGMTRIAVAARREDGKVHVELVASRAGTHWVKGWFLDQTKPWRREWPITGQGRGAHVSSLLDELESVPDPDSSAVDPQSLLHIVRWQGEDLAKGCGAFYGAVVGMAAEDFDGDTEIRPTVFHRPSPILDVAAGTAVTKAVGDGLFIWDRAKSPVDISGLVAVTGAYWLLGQPVEEEAESAYEHHGLEVI